MTHDIDDLLEIIKELEERVILLEKLNSLQGEKIRNMLSQYNGEDSWYWEHG